MKIYIDADNNEVYTEKTIDEEITKRMETNDYDGVFDYLLVMFNQSELFAMLPEDVRSGIFESYKETTIRNEFFEREIDDSSCPCDKCPFSK